ncbi:MAG: pyridoxal-phosphate dependent enzyme [Thermoplasmata archaeon]|nr:pyridoxal-phosphate dependent enzyme [Thermoplasmata archaeon]
MRARAVVRSVILRTPLIAAPSLPGIPDGRVFLKLENLQRSGSFKLRGAYHKIATLSPAERTRGVIAASGGNHAIGVAWAAREAGTQATVVVPKRASPLKVRRARELGATVVQSGADYAEAHDTARRRSLREGLAMVEPFDDPAIIAGQGTIGLEILEDLPNVRSILAGVGGGGLLAGIGVGSRTSGRDPQLFGVQPAGSATFGASLRLGTIVERGLPTTIADGLATRRIGDLTFAILRRLRARSLVVEDGAIARAALALLDRGSIVAEPAAAAPLAALLRHPEIARRGPVVLVISGGNIDEAGLAGLRARFASPHAH